MARLPKFMTPPALPRTPGKRAAKRAAKPPRSPGVATWHHARFVGAAGSRPYSVYVPRRLRKNMGVPLLLLFHGCGQRPADFAAATRFNQAADRHGFVVAYPEQTPAHNRQRCWNWFEPGHQARAAGEPAILAGITEVVAAEPRRWRIDPADPVSGCQQLLEPASAG